MKKQVTDRQKRELARRKAMPIALIQSPLKFIASKDVIPRSGLTIPIHPASNRSNCFFASPRFLCKLIVITLPKGSPGKVLNRVVDPG